MTEREPGDEPAHDEREYHPAMDWTKVSVTVDDEHLDTIDDVAEGLRERGMQVEQVLPSVGIVTGSAQDIAALNSVPGVASVDLEEGIDIGPPDQEIQ
ncbi:hypothetical protein [Agromyces flavus]|uniref:Ketohydroxyglutarate aldolase n=2 Tax=Agromyces flavus TaxID=589382 RepID=A0A1H1W8E2_9MICO|nr:hypothetical protein [Agromyces flavus]GGI44018.1 hypothetical protein GCM10010932_02510 [Agromyces flavus]SDS93354.1 hypothetical protein SAMN04489721_2180 [Agromyces flavus]